MPGRPAIRRQPRSTARRREVLDAALDCFAKNGIAGTAIEDICSRSGTSVGSLYHQFGSKAGIAAALYLDALADFQAAVGARLAPATGARAGVQALIAAHLEWVGRHPGRARFLQEMRRADAVAVHEEEIRALNRAFGQAIGAWAQKHIAAGRLRRLPVDLFIAQLLGPAHEYVRGHLAGRESTPPDVAARLLGDAAWRAIGIDRPEKTTRHGGAP